tara:strand:- start:978 stop:1265 length:288 start_codon:yes stop_codon:yes gene_type:complete
MRSRTNIRLTELIESKEFKADDLWCFTVEVPLADCLISDDIMIDLMFPKLEEIAEEKGLKYLETVAPMYHYYRMFDIMNGSEVVEFECIVGVIFY